MFLADSKLGHIDWDFEEYNGYWFISDRMKSLIETTDLEGFAFLQRDLRSRDGTDQPLRWLCDVVRVVDAVDEEKSTVGIGTASDGSKVYHITSRAKCIFKESVVGKFHIFRMRYRMSKVICDGEFMRVCKSAAIKGISFYPTE
jgi:hypothetical protein